MSLLYKFHGRYALFFLSSAADTLNMASHLFERQPTAASLQAQSHSAKALIRAITKPIKKSAETNEAENDLKSWQDRFSRALDAAPNHKSSLSRAFLRECLQLVNDLFFFGALTNVTIRWSRALPPAHRGATAPDGRLISINIHQKKRDFCSYAACILCVVAHEALHAFLRQYGCRACETCRLA